MVDRQPLMNSGERGYSLFEKIRVVIGEANGRGRAGRQAAKVRTRAAGSGGGQPDDALRHKATDLVVGGLHMVGDYDSWPFAWIGTCPMCRAPMGSALG